MFASSIKVTKERLYREPEPAVLMSGLRRLLAKGHQVVPARGCLASAATSSLSRICESFLAQAWPFFILIPFKSLRFLLASTLD